LRVTRKINYDADDDFVPKCSAHLVAKSISSGSRIQKLRRGRCNRTDQLYEIK
jgi:hypothetical protein